MIKFSQFLQDNEKKKNEADFKKNEEMKVGPKKVYSSHIENRNTQETDR